MEATTGFVWVLTNIGEYEESGSMPYTDILGVYDSESKALEAKHQLFLAHRAYAEKKADKDLASSERYIANPENQRKLPHILEAEQKRRAEILGNRESYVRKDTQKLCEGHVILRIPLNQRVDGAGIGAAQTTAIV